MILSMLRSKHFIISSALLFYLICLLGIPIHHIISEMPLGTADCSACSETINSDKTTFSEKCDPQQPCHNRHSHHNHPLHNHNCFQCISIQKNWVIGLPQCIDNSIGLFLSEPYICSEQGIFNNPISQSIDIRGPPVL